jgi:hypothetical protein
VSLSFPVIYWINLDRAKARRERMTTALATRGLAHTRVKAVDGHDPQQVLSTLHGATSQPTEAACLASHLTAIKQAFEAGLQSVIILEDDASFELFDRWPAGWATISRALPKDFGMVLLCVGQEPPRLDQLYRRSEALVQLNDCRYWGTITYLLDRAGMAALMAAFDRGAHFLVAEHQAPHLADSVLTDALSVDESVSGPWISRVPLFVFDTLDSDIHQDHLAHQQRARDFIVSHHDALVEGAYVSPFTLTQRVMRVAQNVGSWLGYLPRWAFDHLADRAGYFPKKQPPTKYFSQHALAFACDANGGAPYVMWGIEGRPRLLDLSTYAQVRRGDLVWVRIEDLARFNREVLPHVTEPFVLVTAESDYSVPSDFAEPAATIAASGKVLRWYATNYDHTNHQDLVTALPLGMNYRKKHDLHFVQRGKKRTLLRRERFSLAEQEARWEAIAASAKPLEHRVRRVYGDFWLNNSSAERRYGESRADIHAQLRHNPCLFFPTHLVTNEALLAAYARHAFVLSPHGRGLDCYRTWEALFVGCIVIVKTSPIDPLYRDLPVVIVKSWDEITEANLERWLVSFGSGFDRGLLKQTLSLEHWLARARGAASE